MTDHGTEWTKVPSDETDYKQRYHDTVYELSQTRLERDLLAVENKRLRAAERALSANTDASYARTLEAQIENKSLAARCRALEAALKDAADLLAAIYNGQQLNAIDVWQAIRAAHDGASKEEQ